MNATKEAIAETLNLPKTDFAMKAGLPNREKVWLKQWQQDKLYHKIQDARKDAKTFILHDGPPYANGQIHLGHVLNKILKDMIIKSKTLEGYRVPYTPGWDCHGLPIELQVEKKHGKVGQKVDANTFRGHCRNYAKGQVDLQREDFKRLGVLGDWEDPYLSMNPKYEASIIRALATIIDNNHLKRGYKPVHFCCDCGSSLAEAEVEYKDKESHAITIAFALADHQALLEKIGLKDTSINSIDFLVWTTTPWTLPANEALAIGEDITYALVRHKEQTLIVAKERIDTLFKDHEHQILAEIDAASLHLQKAQHPFYDKHVPIIFGAHVNVDAGTGVVHTAPAHGVEDYQASLVYNIPFTNPVGKNGVFEDNVPLFKGQYYAKANQSIIDTLEANKRLWHHEKIIHSYPHCWRHKTPLIFRATPQWFIAVDDDLKAQAKKAIDGVEWVPNWGQARIETMIENRPDWCISRQRTWGTPIALYLHKETGELHPQSTTLMRKVADLVEKDGIEAWFNLDHEAFLGADSANYEPVKDTLDVWFDSGVSFFSVLEQRANLHYPADLYLEGSDQHRGWFQTSLLASLAMSNKAPFKQVLTHGFVVDAKGHKMSKSQGNIIAPQTIIDQYGADILRLWAANVDYHGEANFSNDILKRVVDRYRRIRNTARFLLANLHDFNPQTHLLEHHKLLPLDQWAIARAHQLQAQIKTAYSDYQFHHASQSIHDFCAFDMGSFYLDIIKDRQYTGATDSIMRRSAQTAIYHIVNALARWLAPITSFTANEIYQHIPGNDSQDYVFTEHWYDNLAPLSSESVLSLEDWQVLLDVRSQVNKALEHARKEKRIGSSLAACVTIYATGKNLACLQTLDKECHFLFICSKAQIVQLKEKPAQAQASEDPELFISVEPSTEEKCQRCWHHCASVGSDARYPGICTRCISNAYGSGEVRNYV